MKTEPEVLKPGAVSPTESTVDTSDPSERRATPRQNVKATVVIYLIGAGSVLYGHILDLSLGGCHIRIADRFEEGLETRVEVEFSLEGLPVRLAGVVQAFRDPARHHIGIRFLEMSERKKRQVQVLIREIQEMRALRALEFKRQPRRTFND